MTQQQPTDDVPKIPRKLGIRLTGPEMLRIMLTLATLVAVVVLAKPCGNAVSTFVMGFGSGSAGSAKGSGSAVQPYERITPDMNDEQVREAVERAKQRNRELGSASGSGYPAMGSGSNATTGPGAAPILNGSATRVPANGSAGSNTKAIDPASLHMGGTVAPN